MEDGGAPVVADAVETCDVPAGDVAADDAVDAMAVFALDAVLLVFD